MFLDQQLLELGRKGHSNMNPRKLEKVEWEMLQACLENLKKNILQKVSDETVINNFRRVDNTWKKAVKQLQGEGFTASKPSGFQVYITKSGDFPQISKDLWGKQHG